MELSFAAEVGQLKLGAGQPFVGEGILAVTKALLQSTPSIESVPRLKLATISGSIPHPFNRPTGCPFHPRCGDAMADRCTQRQSIWLCQPNHGSARC